MKSLLAVVVVMTIYVAQPAQAQYSINSFLIGPTIGVGGWGGSLVLGANGEKAIIDAGKVGPGMVGLGARLDYASYGDAYWTYTIIAFGVFAQYHMQFGDDHKWDPYAGIGLGYEHWGVSGTASTLLYGYAGASGIYTAFDAGIRYFFSPNFAARAQLGFGLALLSLGVDLGL